MNIQLLAPLAAVSSLVFAGLLALKMLQADQGTGKMKEISLEVRRGATAYLRRQYKTAGKFIAGMFVVLLALAMGLGWVPIFTPFAFLTGAFYSTMAGFIGMNIATRANARTAAACRTSLNGGLKIAFSGGAVMGFTVVGLGLLDISLWYFFLSWFYSNVEILPDAERVRAISATMVTFGMGVSIMCLFARVGGGVYTKAADVGADLVGKIEEDIPEDDPRNPAVIADNVGDNVGDVAGMGADLHESYVSSILAAIALAAAAGLGLRGIVLPMAIAALGIFCSIGGTWLVRAKEDATQSQLLATLRTAVYGSSALIAVAAFFLVNYLLPGQTGIYLAVLAGLIAGNLLGFTTEYFTSAAYEPTRELAKSSATGPAAVIINGLSLGMVSAFLPAIIVGVTILFSFAVAGGVHAFVPGAGGESGDFAMGLFGVGVAAVGMLSTLGLTLAADAYGPIADNAGGIAEMAGLGEKVRQRTDALDALGNTTAATGKGFAIGSAALTSLALIAAYREEVLRIAAGTGINFSMEILNPAVLIGLFIGAALPFVFSSMTMKAVARAAESIVLEVRRQFRDTPGLREGTAKPDSGRCVDICTQSALSELVMPTILTIATPLLVGLFLGVSGTLGLLIGCTVSGFALALMMVNAGGAWDNAKKHIEEGNFGGKGGNRHKAAVVGDTVGDPFKDTSGPSINTMLKLVSIVSIVFATMVIEVSGIFPWN